MENELRFRQVHLDFHTSENIPEVGTDFDPEEFARTVEKARVDSITCFARCHHGWLYYDSEKFSHLVHPNLKNKNLLKQQIQACREKGINAPIYITVQWDHKTAEEHPEWLTIDPNGKQDMTGPYEAGFYRWFCLNTPYVDYLKELTKDVIDNLPVDGFFFDIVLPRDCSCRYCRKDMIEAGLDPYDKDARKAWGLKVVQKFKKEMTDFVRQYVDDPSIFYNAGHVAFKEKESIDAYTHFELESLPSGFWGYMHFPITSRYARKLGKDILGMTGKFHTAWGDFHSFKNKAALEFESFLSLALNAKICIGDQLHPTGKICKTTYDLIGSVYSQVEKKEPWCRSAEPVTEIAVFNPEEYFDVNPAEGLSKSLKGVTRMLQEGSYQFDIIDSEMDFEKYKLLILADEIPVNEKFAEKLEHFITKGGKIITSFESALDEQKGFTFDSMPVEYKFEKTLDRKGQKVRGEYYPQHDFVDYMIPGEKISEGFDRTEHVMYLRGVKVNAKENAEVLADCVKSYFDRDYRHFCSHLQTPSSGEKEYPSIVTNGKVTYFSNPIFKSYEINAPLWCKKLLFNVLNLMLDDKLVSHDGPSSVITALNEQKGESRQVLHILHYIPERRSEKIDVIEDVIPIYNVNFYLKQERKVKSVKLVPENKELQFEQKGGKVSFAVDKVDGHQMVEINY